MQIDRLRDTIRKLQEEAQQQAIKRYYAREKEIENIRKSLQLVHNGLMPLLDLDPSANRVEDRIERENAPRAIAVERINGSNDLQEVAIIEKLLYIKNAVCRITVNGQGIGTGIHIAEGVILTNHHVIPDVAMANQLEVEFDYELDVSKKLKKTTKCALKPQLFFCTSGIAKTPNDPTSGLDFTMVAFDIPDSFTEYPPVKLDGTLGKVVVGEQCITIQHPGGETKKIVCKDIALLKLTDTHIIYESDTMPGSSGSPVIGLGTGEIIALHHAGVPKRNKDGLALTKTGAIAYDGTPDEQIDWEGNEGIRLSCILDALSRMALKPEMQAYREAVLFHTKIKRNKPGKNEGADGASAPKITLTRPEVPETVNQTTMIPFNILLKNEIRSISAVNSYLSTRYNTAISIEQVTPLSAVQGEEELFTFSAIPAGTPEEEALNLTRFPYILAAEADMPMHLNYHEDVKVNKEGIAPFESKVAGAVWEDEFSKWNEEEFLQTWKSKSNYIDENDRPRTRRWNHEAVRFNTLSDDIFSHLSKSGIVIGQLDTGFTKHSKISGGFDFERDYDAVDNDDTAEDELTRGILKFPGHGIRTGSLLIGREPDPYVEHDGNLGLLTKGGTRIIPYRIAKTVILVDRQKELASAIDKAISGGVEILTMSMGTAPTITTAKLAKKVYDAGIIWCCAAGNEVKFVIAPAVFPGTIAVAASNPNDAPWPKSSEGGTVDITAPGEDVYVPIFHKDDNGKVKEEYAYGDGTSYATPHIAAAAALWISKYRNELGSFKGWQKVEAFRMALKNTARKKHNLRSGYGAGILDMNALLNNREGKPGDGVKLNQLKYAYNNWNDKAVLAAMQGWSELFKTYWKIAHRGLRRLFGGESVDTLEAVSLSPFAKEQESILFGSSLLESTGSISPEEATRRLQVLNTMIFENSTL